MNTLPIDNKGYWADRAQHDLYRLTVATARAMFPRAKSAIDVGCYTSGLICELDWIPTRVASDINPNLAANWRDVPDVRFVPGDAFTLEFAEQPFDLVVSNQTIEHLSDPPGFVDKLLSLGRGLIISTTYETPAGLIAGHVQDPIDFEKFVGWFPVALDAYTICHHPGRKIKHIIGVIRESHPSAVRVG